MVGVIMIVGLLITPPALAYMLTDRLPRMMFLAAIIAILSVILGLYFSEWVNASGGGAIMFMGFLLFMVGLVLAPRYGLLAGWLRRHRLVPQTDIEDILKAGFVERPLAQLQIPRPRVRRALRELARQELVASADGGHVQLTEQGRHEAAHILRSHQLWEGHFIQQGMDPERAHVAAETLEHLHDRHVLDRFDNELDHPTVDRGGIAIPGEQEAQPDRAPRLRLCLLRHGDRARSAQTRPGVPELPEDAEFTVESRDPDTGAWHVTRADGTMVAVSHEEADEFLVRRLR
jgi:manganese/iron transport system permease protein/iron/zinc/copper transport system permease protein